MVGNNLPTKLYAYEAVQRLQGNGSSAALFTDEQLIDPEPGFYYNGSNVLSPNPFGEADYGSVGVPPPAGFISAGSVEPFDSLGTVDFIKTFGSLEPQPQYKQSGTLAEYGPDYRITPTIYEPPINFNQTPKMKVSGTHLLLGIGLLAGTIYLLKK